MGGRTKTLGDLLKPLVTAKTSPERLWERLQVWPPDLFAVTSLLLDQGRYERIVDPPRGQSWPTKVPSGTWHEHVQGIARSWKHQLTYGRTPRGWPPEVRDWFNQRRPAFLAAATCDASRLRDLPWTEFAAIVDLHAAADEASSGLGVPGPSSLFDFDGAAKLGTKGSLATFPPEVVRVLPKLHTPQRGMTLRSTSHHLSALRSTFGVKWVNADQEILSNESLRERRIGILLVPWPFTGNNCYSRLTTAMLNIP